MRQGASPRRDASPRASDPDEGDLVDDFVLHDMVNDEDEHDVG